MRMLLLLTVAMSVGCEPQIEQSAQQLAVYPIPGLPSYDGGRLLHPWHVSKPDRDRFPARPTRIVCLAMTASTSAGSTIARPPRAQVAHVGMLP